MRPGDAAWSAALDRHLSPEREECPQCGGDVEEDEDGIRCVEGIQLAGLGENREACDWRVDRPEPDDYEDPGEDRWEGW